MTSKKKIYSKYIAELRKINKNYGIEKVKSLKKLHIKNNKFKSFLKILIKKDFLFYFK